MEEPGGLQFMGLLRVGYDWATSLSLFTFMHWRRKWQPTPVFLPGESQGRGSLVGCRLWGRVTQSWTRLKWLSSSSSSSTCILQVKVAQSCPTLCDLMDYTVHGILQTRILEWVAFPFSRGSSQPRDRTQVSLIAGGFFTSRATREAQEYWSR